MTSDALITAVTWLPSVRPRSRTASTVIDATRRTPLASSSTLAIASPEVMPVTLAGIWFRALSRMTYSPSCDQRNGSPPYRQVPRRLNRSRTGPGDTCPFRPGHTAGEQPPFRPRLVVRQFLLAQRLEGGGKQGRWLAGAQHPCPGQVRPHAPGVGGERLPAEHAARGYRIRGG